MTTYLISLVAGLLLPLGFAPFHLYLLAIASPILLLLMLTRSNLKQSFWHGFVFGIGYFGLGISWVYISIHRFGHAPLSASIAITAILIMVMSLFTALTCLSAKYFARSYKTLCLLTFPLCWVALEYLRTLIPFGGFPWLLLGYSQTTLALSGYAPIFGIYFISWVIVFSAGCLALFVHSPIRRSLVIACFSMVFLWLAGDLLHHINWTKSLGKPISVSLIQGNIPQSIKWNPLAATHTLNRYWHLTQQYLNSDLIVWPEAAIPEYPQNIPTYLNKLNTLRTNLLTGIPIYHIATQTAYNGLMSFGTAHGTYLKRHLVPFGEYFPAHDLLAPLMHELKIPMSGFTPGPNKQPLVTLHIGKRTLRVSPFICYEIVYPQLVLDSIQNANLLLTVSDDSWFGNSIARPQHLQIAQMQSQMLGRSQLFSSNNGISALINASGDITQTAPKDQLEVLSGKIQPMQGKTPLMYWGFWASLLLWLVGFGIVIYHRYIKKT